MNLTLFQHIEGAFGRGLLRLPRAWLVRLGGAPVSRAGFELDTQIAFALRLRALLGRKHWHEQSVTEARASMDVDTVLLGPVAPPLERVEDVLFPGPNGDLPARIYRPHGAPRPSPAIVFFHGGGMVLGSLASHDAPCRVLAAETGCVVIAVDYRLAPEHRFPAPVEDALAAFRHVATESSTLGLDSARLAVCGDSAGGTLSAVVALETRGDEVRPCFQVLLYPGVDLTSSFPSIAALGEGFLLEKASIEWFVDLYLPPGQDRRDPRVSPLFAPDHAGAPPAFVLTAGFDPLRDEGEAYAEALRAAGVAVEHRCYEELTHGFFNMSGSILAARVPFADVVAALRRALG